MGSMISSEKNWVSSSYWFRNDENTISIFCHRYCPWWLFGGMEL